MSWRLKQWTELGQDIVGEDSLGNRDSGNGERGGSGGHSAKRFVPGHGNE